MQDLEGMHSYWEVWSKEFNVLLMMMIIVSMPYCTVRCMKSTCWFSCFGLGSGFRQVVVARSLSMNHRAREANVRERTTTTSTLFV